MRICFLEYKFLIKREDVDFMQRHIFALSRSCFVLYVSVRLGIYVKFYRLDMLRVLFGMAFAIEFSEARELNYIVNQHRSYC